MQVVPQPANHVLVERSALCTGEFLSRLVRLRVQGVMRAQNAVLKTEHVAMWDQLGEPGHGGIRLQRFDQVLLSAAVELLFEKRQRSAAGLKERFHV